MLSGREGWTSLERPLNQKGHWLGEHLSCGLVVSPSQQNSHRRLDRERFEIEVDVLY